MVQVLAIGFAVDIIIGTRHEETALGFHQVSESNDFPQIHNLEIWEDMNRRRPQGYQPSMNHLSFSRR